MLLFLLSGVLLLRFDVRTFAGSLFQLPPRNTRFDSGPFPFYKNMIRYQIISQMMAVRVGGVGDP